MSVDLNKLIGIPFKLNRKDYEACDCRGIVYLYFKHVRNIEIPFTDGGNIYFRNILKDKERMINVIKTFADPIPTDNLDAGDIIIIKNCNNTGALGVCINKYQVLHMDKIVGSCLTKIDPIRRIILVAYRPR